MTHTDYPILGAKYKTLTKNDARSRLARIRVALKLKDTPEDRGVAITQWWLEVDPDKKIEDAEYPDDIRAQVDAALVNDWRSICGTPKGKHRRDKERAKQKAADEKAALKVEWNERLKAVYTRELLMEMPLDDGLPLGDHTGKEAYEQVEVMESKNAQLARWLKKVCKSSWEEIIREKLTEADLREMNSA